MSGWHPLTEDGGLLPNAADPQNPANAFNPSRPPLATAPLYYGNGCNVRLRPAVINSLISENLSTVDSVGMNYNPNSLINLRTAVEYIEQKSLPEFSVLSAQGTPTNYYTGALYPPLLGGYNNGMTLCVVPNLINQGFVRIDVGGGWWVPVLRNDYAELEAGDWPAAIPQCIAYYNGAFYMLGIAKSQVPIVLKGAIYFWIRPDGNDTTGDGSVNTPDKAFRTINGAWYAVGSRYSASPNSHIGFLLGTPGDYEGGNLGPYGAGVSLTGDINNAAGYRIHTNNWVAGEVGTWGINANGINAFTLQGVALVMDRASQTPYGNRGLSVSRTAATTNNVDIIVAVPHPYTSKLLAVEYQSNVAESAGWIGTPSSYLRFFGNDFAVETVVYFGVGSTMTDHAPDFFTPPVWYFENIGIRYAGIQASTFSSVNNDCRQWVQSGCTGRRWIVNGMSNLGLGNRGLPPGSEDGIHDQFSVVSGY